MFSIVRVVSCDIFIDIHYCLRKKIPFLTTIYSNFSPTRVQSQTPNVFSQCAQCRHVSIRDLLSKYKTRQRVNLVGQYLCHPFAVPPALRRLDVILDKLHV